MNEENSLPPPCNCNECLGYPKTDLVAYVLTCVLPAMTADQAQTYTEMIYLGYPVTLTIGDTTFPIIKPSSITIQL